VLETRSRSRKIDVRLKMNGCRQDFHAEDIEVMLLPEAP